MMLYSSHTHINCLNDSCADFELRSCVKSTQYVDVANSPHGICEHPGLPVPNSPHGICGHPGLPVPNSPHGICGHPGLPVPNSPHGICGRKATLD